MSTTAETYVDQLLLERNRPYSAGLLWVMGLHGRLEQDRLVLDSADHPERKECERLIRKSDNSPHKATRDAISKLAEAGIRIHCQTRKKGWTLSLSIDEEVGDASLVGLLKEYIAALVAAHGIPNYVSGYDLRGEAFRKFKEVDMDVFSKASAELSSRAGSAEHRQPPLNPKTRRRKGP